jgi:hypothetical protein
MEINYLIKTDPYLTPYRTALLYKLTSPRLVKQFLADYGTRQPNTFRYHSYRAYNQSYTATYVHNTFNNNICGMFLCCS